MQKSDFRKAYHSARIGQTADTLESIAAIIALQDRRKVDQIGSSYRFAYDLSGVSERIQKREEMRARRMARKNAKPYNFDYSILNQGE